MNKKKFLSLFVLLLFLYGCTPQFPAMKSAFISPVDLGMTDTLYFTDPAFSPDGQTIVWYCKQYNLETGGESYPYENYTGIPNTNKACFVVANGAWSSNGRWLGVSEDIDDTGFHWRYLNWVVDTQSQTAYTVAGRVFWAWSPFGTGSYLTRNEDVLENLSAVLSVYNLDNQSDPVLLDGSIQYDFSQEPEVGGTGRYLWSKRLDLPIAELTWSRDGMAENMRRKNLLIQSLYDFAIPGERLYQQILIDDPNAHIVGAIFDPTGEYVLVAQWECTYTDVTHCSDVPYPPVLDGITDSVFTLIRWRTGESRELFRLSSVDAQNVVASGNLLWSADGDTILIGRIGASFIVLKVKD